MLKLRLTRMGSKKRPVYRIAAMEALSRRDGKAVAYLGNYYPLEEGKVTLKEE
ncbi:MAG: 30S ribosomal protein S16, partial [Cetobacterium sp.]